MLLAVLLSLDADVVGLVDDTLDDPVSPDALLAVPAELVALSEDDEDDFFPWSRKSVTYQPLPFSAKPAAVTCLTILG